MRRLHWLAEHMSALIEVAKGAHVQIGCMTFNALCDDILELATNTAALRLVAHDTLDDLEGCARVYRTGGRGAVSGGV